MVTAAFESWAIVELIKAMSKGIITAGFWAAVGLTVGLLLGQGSGVTARAQVARQPFASSIQQRQQIIAELRRLNSQIEKQNQLLASGRLRVVVEAARQEPGQP